MNLDPPQISAWRLTSQQLLQPRWRQPERIVEWLGGVQAQDAAWAEWSIGLRMRDGTASKVEKAVAERRIVRTWAFRGTLHYLAASDLPWVIPLLAPTIVARNARRYRQLELDEATFATSERVIRRALKEGSPLVRAEISRVLEGQGLSARGQRLYYLLQRAALDGVICHGPQRGRDPTYVLVSEWLGSRESLDPGDARAALAERYLIGHGPATVQDLAWWAGLPVAVAREALKATPLSKRIKIDGEELWAANEQPPLSREDTAYLLPPFDDYLLGYKDRSRALDPAYSKQVNAGGGMPKPTIVVNGEIVGTWLRTIKRERMAIALDLFCSLDETARTAVQAAARLYGEFNGIPAEIVHRDWQKTGQ